MRHQQGGSLYCRSIADFNFDHPHAFAFDEIVECLRSLKQGRPVQIPQVTHLQQRLLPAAAPVLRMKQHKPCCLYMLDLIAELLSGGCSKQQKLQAAQIARNRHCKSQILDPAEYAPNCCSTTSSLAAGCPSPLPSIEQMSFSSMASWPSTMRAFVICLT